MALFNETPDEPVTPPSPITPKIESKFFDGITVDTSYVPSSALLTWIEGSNWRVEYFSQVLGADNEPTPLDIHREAAYQQYRRIRDMDLKVTQPISFSQDSSTNVMTVTGAGMTYPFLVPNKGDMFIADVGDGRVGLFTVTQATRATILRDSVYSIEYTMTRELDRTHMDDLESKTIEEFHYSQASLISGCGPFVTEADKVRGEDYAKLRCELLSMYLTDFFSYEHNTLLVPDQLNQTYDHFLTRFFNRTIGTDEDKRVRRVRELNVSAEPIMGQPTIWDAVMRLDDMRLFGVPREAHCVSTAYFRGRPTLQAIGYTGIPRLVFPKGPSSDVDSFYDMEHTRRPIGIPFHEGRPRRPTGEYVSQAVRNPLWFQAGEPNSGDPWRVPPDIHPVVHDEHYVLSRAFYEENPAEQSKLEQLVMQALKGEPLNLPQLDALLVSVREWDNLERFYYYPLLFVLLQLGA